MTGSAEDPDVYIDGVSQEAIVRDIADGMDSIQDASPPVPSAEEMASSVDESSGSTADRADREAAREVAEASAARAAEASDALATEYSNVVEAAEADQERATGADGAGSRPSL
ncbi:MAG: hypothetical protein V5A43_07735 [Haloarculaceae archaeon]